MGCQGSNNAVRTKLPGIVNEEFNAQVQRMIYHQGFFSAIALSQFLKDGSKRRYNARHDNIIDISKLVADMARQVSQQHSILIGCTLARGRYHPMVLHRLTIIEAKLEDRK